jgi:DNA-binding Lrp family transcriptional regulator
VIAGYTIRLGAAAPAEVRALVSLVVDGRRAEAVLSALRAIDEVRAVHSTSGAFDLVALVACPDPVTLDTVIDRMGSIPGVERTTTALLLATKFERDP